MGVAFVRNRQLAEVRLTEDLRAEIGNKPSSCVAHAFSGSCLLSSEAKPIQSVLKLLPPFSLSAADCGLVAAIDRKSATYCEGVELVSAFNRLRSRRLHWYKVSTSASLSFASGCRRTYLGSGIFLFRTIDPIRDKISSRSSMLYSSHLDMFH